MPAAPARMKLTFIGTRGYIDAKTQRHGRHSALLVALRGRRIMIDCGEDWRGRLRTLRLNAILITHAHPDHIGGLDRGAPCPVYATAETRRLAASCPISAWRIIKPRRPVRVAGFAVEAFRVTHSLRAPAVGYLGWCRREGVARAVFTHCGSEIVTGDARRVARQVRLMGKERGVDAQVAHDGLELVLA